MSVEAIKLWYEYLREASPETWSDKVRKDFGGVLTSNFEDWIDEVRFDLFANYGMKSDALPVRAMREPKGADKINFDTHLVLVIDISKPISFLMPRIESRLRVNSSANIKAGRTKWEPTLAKYPFASRPDVAALKTTLLMYVTKKENPEWPNWKVGEYVQSKVEATNPILMKHKIKEGDTQAIKISKKKMLEQVTTRYLKNANALITNVAIGIFPSSKPIKATTTKSNTHPVAADK
jgi:GTPase SAR1 family protein